MLHVQDGARVSDVSWQANCQYLDGSVDVGFLAAVVHQAGNSDSVRQIVDEGNIVD